MSRRKQKRGRQGEGKHRTVGISEETPGFKNKRIKSRKSSRIAKQSRRFNRNK